ncbi:MAG: hypothetical protein KF744_16365 [Taibaiella sp.]|nr:hypothetical protein [Taibaiella sp.]
MTESLNSKTDVTARGSVLNNSWEEHHTYRTRENESKLIGGVTTSRDGFLIFASRDSYDYVLSILGKYDDLQLDHWERSMGFTSAFTAFSYPEQFDVNSEDNLNSLFEDDFLLRILDKNGLVQIGNQVFNLQVNNYRLLAINQNSFLNFQDAFVQGIFIPSVMNQFNTLDEIDVFDILDTGITGIDYNVGVFSDSSASASAKTIGNGKPKMTTDPPPPPPPPPPGGTIGNGKPRMTGGESKPPAPGPDRTTIFTNKNQYNDDVSGEGINGTFRADVKASYQKAAIYFSLMAELKYMKRISSSSIWRIERTDICFVMNPTFFMSYCSYKKRGSSSTDVPTVPHQQWVNRKVMVNKLNWRPYEGSRQLDNYVMNVMFAYQNVVGSDIREVQVYINKG